MYVRRFYISVLRKGKENLDSLGDTIVSELNTNAEMKYMRRTAGYTRTDYKTNTQIAKELKITQILDKLLEYKRN
jgi:hypothetical protein